MEARECFRRRPTPSRIVVGIVAIACLAIAATFSYHSWSSIVLGCYSITAAVSLLAACAIGFHVSQTSSSDYSSNELEVFREPASMMDSKMPAPLLECIRNRRSVFPRHYHPNKRVSRAVMQRLLEAAMWAPYHGSVPPWRFVVLGRKAIVEMQHLTLSYYDENWRKAGWANGKVGQPEKYFAWRQRIENEIHTRWKSVSYMVAIIMRRQAGSKRMPEWEEAAATACAVQNMHLQASTQPDLACYWSSWHAAARDSSMMSKFLNMKVEDKCLGFFIVAHCAPNSKTGCGVVRTPEKHLATEWRD